MSFQTVKQSIRIAAEPRDIWDALMDPQAGEKWRNAHFTTDWRAGDPIENQKQSSGQSVTGTKGASLKSSRPPCSYTPAGRRVSGLFQTSPKSRSTITMTLEAEGTDCDF